MPSLSPIETRVNNALNKVQPGAAFDIGMIIQLITTLMGFLQNCPFGRASAAIKDGAIEAKVAIYRAVRSSGYAGNAAELTLALLEEGKSATDDEINATLNSSAALPKLL